MATRLRLVVSIALALCTMMPAARPIAAQDAVPRAQRQPASVEYVGADGIYLGVGSDQGAVRGDTVAVYASEDEVGPRGLIVFTSVTRRRAVAVAIDAGLVLRVGDTVYMPLVPPTTLSDTASAVSAAVTGTPRQSSPRTSAGPRVTGRVALDLEARETRTSWSGDLFGETRRRFAVPTSRLAVSVTDLPGGIAVRANVRASYRYDDLTGGPPPISVRAYELSAAKSFDSFPLELVIGRFSNPYERYSAYWDGGLFRLGRERGLGIGAAIGFEPDQHDELPSRALPKLTAFADFAASGDAWRYDTDASFHVARPADGAQRRFIGWSQRIAVGRFSFDQRARADDGAGGTGWSLTHLRVRGTLRLGGALRLRSTYSRTDGTLAILLPSPDSLAQPVRHEITMGFDLSGAVASVSADAGRTERGGDAPGFSMYGAGAVRMGAAQLQLSGRRWTRGGAASSSVAPGLSFRYSSLDLRAGYRLYRTSDGARAIISHSAEGQIAITLAQGTRVALLAEQQWGASLSGTRLGLSLWRSF
jgi:hypothetical protein